MSTCRAGGIIGRYAALLHISFRPNHDPGVDSALSENKYQGVKAAGA